MTRIATNLCIVSLLLLGICGSAIGAGRLSGSSMPPKLTSLSLFRPERISVGIGGGFNYGGLGSNVQYYLTPQVALYAGGGTDFQSANYSVGLKLRKITGQSWNVNPYVLANYGYNGRLDVSSDPGMTRSFDGLALGFGLDQKLDNRKKGYFTIGVLVPVHGASYHEYAEYVQGAGLPSPKPVIPVRLTFGYRFVIR